MPDCRSWTTEGIAEAKKLDYWRQVVNEAVFDMDVKVSKVGHFHGSIDSIDIGPIAMSHIDIHGTQVIHRSARAISRSAKSQFEFVVMQEGQVHVEQCGRSMTLKPGDSLLIDGRQPYTLTTQKPRARNLSFHLPVEWLELWLSAPDKLTAYPMRNDDHWGRVIYELSRAIQLDVSEGHTINGSLCADQLAGVISLALSSQAEQLRDRSAGVDMLAKAKSHLRERAHEHELTAAVVADSLQISVRYLHKLFANDDTTFSTELYAAKLDTSLRMLKSHQYADLSIAEIAWRAGFSDTSHFFRRFKRHYGCVPSSVRQ